jgi:hypothetical protein
MPTVTRIIAICGSLALLMIIVELVRRRRLKEEYSLLWILTALTLLVLSIWYGLLLDITDVIGAVLPSSTLFFFGTAFLILMVLHFSVRVSELERRTTAAIQELGLLALERREREAQAALERGEPPPGLEPGVAEPEPEEPSSP